MALAWLLAAGGGLATGAASYLLALAIAALLPARPSTEGSGSARLVVIVPAYNEAGLIERCVASLRDQTYPAARRRIVVVADNCTDRTAEIATAAGADVLIRTDPALRGKGRTLRWALDLLLADDPLAEAFLVVDADSIAAPRMLGALEGAMSSGAEVVQAEYLVLDEPGTGSQLRQAAFLLFHRTRFAGRARLGMSCNLVGNGMLFRREVLERVPWDAYTGAEDLEYSITLRLAGVKPRYAPGAQIFGPAPGRGRAAATQRMRWEGGRFHVVRTRLGRLVVAAVRSRDWTLLDAAADLAVPPLGLLVLLTLAGGAVTTALWIVGAAPVWSVLPWAVAGLGIAGFVGVGLRAAHAPASAYRALLDAPRFLGAKLGTYLRMTRGLQADRWVRTERPGDVLQQRPDDAS